MAGHINIVTISLIKNKVLMKNYFNFTKKYDITFQSAIILHFAKYIVSLHTSLEFFIFVTLLKNLTSFFSIYFFEKSYCQYFMKNLVAQPLFSKSCNSYITSIYNSKISSV